MIKLFRIILISYVVFFYSDAYAKISFSYPKNVSQGRLFSVKMEGEAPFQGLMYWQSKLVPFFSVPSPTKKHEALVHLGMPVPAKGQQNIDIRASIIYSNYIASQAQLLTIEAEPVAWYEHNLSVEPKFVTPPKTVLKKIAQDRKESRAIFERIRLDKPTEFPLQRPVKGTISGSFAAHRVFNNERRPPHMGTDMRGAIGTPILAVADGEVALAANHYYAGNVIYLDHGQGIVSMYGHLSAFNVKTGDIVKKGQHIGDVGATGRVTGPHLHMSLYMQGVGVDIMPLFHDSYSPIGGPTKEQARPQ